MAKITQFKPGSTGRVVRDTINSNFTNINTESTSNVQNVNTTKTNLGDLTALTTTNKTSIVDAINELVARVRALES